ncbi:hypothetical protein [Pseudoroseicyclus sp. CXY001]|uniref:hypothetical protein n=1 Tax=Pseudoroseicyclus sp. CXY001 TaxID=3242492 RepID=UPI0035717522
MIRALALALLLAPPAAAEGLTDPLRALLAALPAAEVLRLDYAQPVALRPLSTAPTGPEAAAEAVARATGPALVPEVAAMLGGINAALGLRAGDLDEMLRVTGEGFDWRLMRVHGLQWQRIGLALEARGFILAPGYDLQIWALGGEGEALPPAPGDPLGGAEGGPTRIAIAGDLVYRAPDWAGIAALSRPGPPRLAESETLLPLLAALDAAPVPEGSVLASVVILPAGPMPFLIADIAAPGPDAGVLILPAAAPEEARALLDALAAGLPAGAEGRVSAAPLPTIVITGGGVYPAAFLLQTVLAE